MRFVKPKVYLIGKTALDEEELFNYLFDGPKAGDWKTDAPSDSETLIEAAGRACYRSFKVGGEGSNPNVTKVREGNDVYIKNIIKSGHGSVLEHSSANFIFHNVSRVFTHELVRHRVGTAFSQESLRYVRLDDLGLWLPSCIENDPEAKAKFEQWFREDEERQLWLAKHFKLDDTKDFGIKKEVTSAMRRVAPDGLATTIFFSANLRTLRHLIEMRTSRHAEEEIRIVFDQVAKLCKHEFPNVFGDYKREEVDGIGEWTTEFKKV